jgi:predicted dinucleotide-binding enzyme
MRIAIIGSGNVGATLGRRWSELDHDVTFGARDPESHKVIAAAAGAPRATVATIADAVRDAHAVVLAVPYNAVGHALAAAGDLRGKIVIDCTNPIGPDGLVVGTTTSGAEQVAEHAPEARVVKAFNTTGSENMANPQYSDGPLVMPLAGDHEAAKKVVAELAAELGFAPVDVGPLGAARYLEPFAMLWITLARGGMGRDFGFRLVSRQ